QEQRAVRTTHACGGAHPRRGPFEVVGLGQRVLVLVVADAQVVGGRRDDDVDALWLEVTENVKAIGQIEDAFVSWPGFGEGFEDDGHVLMFRTRPSPALITPG